MLGKYRVLEPLGRGGMAQVYRAYHPQLDRYVAIKVLRADLVEETEFLARFQREARAIASLRHPNIVQVFDGDTQDGVYYFVMELLEGDTLKSRLNVYRAQAERMPLSETVHILTDVLHGLEYAHGEGIIHRDLKPANILLSRRGQAVLSDFGIAQIVGGTQYTVSGALMGTLNYMAPEQGLENHCDARSDLYSLGIVFYEMLTGRPPFDADTPLAILMKHLNDPLPLPRKLTPDLPEAFERVALKALSKPPDDRYQTAAEMRQALQSAAAESRLETHVHKESYVHTEASPGIENSASPAQPAAQANPVPAVAAGAVAASALSAPPAQNASASPEPGAAASDAGRQQPANSAENEANFHLSEHLESIRQSIPPETVQSAKTVIHKTAQAATQVVDQISAQPWKARAQTLYKRFMTFPLPRLKMAQAVLIGVTLFVSINLSGVFASVSTERWTMFDIGWPLELLLISLLLGLMAGASGVVWLLIPTGILLGNGLLFTYYNLTNFWGQWGLCWPLEPLILFGSIYGPIWLSRNPERFPDLPRRLGYAAVVLALFGSVIVSLGIAAASVFSLFR